MNKCDFSFFQALNADCSISSFSDLKYFFAYFLLLSPATQLTI